MARRIVPPLAVLVVLSCQSDGPVRPAENRPPTARIAGAHATQEGMSIFFDASGSTDPDGDTLTYAWDFGDGDEHPGRVAPHAYRDEGPYQVSLIVADNRGASDTARATVGVSNAPPIITALTTPPSVLLGTPATIQIAFVDPGMADSLTASVDWGDQNTSSVSNGPASHSYAAVGNYIVTITVRDNDGAVTQQTASSAIVIVPVPPIAGYDVFDLGTLGGNSARPTDFNDYGQIVGSSLTASGNYEAFLWDNGTLRALGTLGRLNSEAQKINNAGVIAGVVWSRPGYYQYEVSMPATWRNGVGALLTNSSFNHAATAVAMNEAGDIVWSAHGHEDPYAWLSRGGSWQRLGGLYHPFAPSWGTSINEHGQIVGSSYSEYTDESAWPPPHAFLWENGAMRDLGLIGFKPCRHYPDKNCGWARAMSTNERGQVVGYSTDSAGSVHAVLWENSTIRDLWLAPPGTKSYPANAVINDGGQIAGSIDGHAFVWSDGVLQMLGSLGGGSTTVVDMNEAGAVVGTSKTASGKQHAFVWTRERGMVDLGTGPHGFSAAWVVGISFGGDIVGYAGPCGSVSGTCYPTETETRAVMWRNTRGSP